MEIPSMFDQISRKYDIANRVLSLGMDTLWRKKALKEAFKHLPAKKIDMLDIACGTGDMLTTAKEIFKDRLNLGVGLDPSLKMVERAKSKCRNLNFHLVLGTAENLPFKENSFDLITVAFGVRNFKNRQKGLKEIYRTLKEGGILTILEFSPPSNGNFLEKLSWFYTKRIVPLLGGVITGNKEAYSYLSNSIERFPTSENLSKELKHIGFQVLVVKKLFPPITVLYVGRKN